MIHACRATGGADRAAHKRPRLEDRQLGDDQRNAAFKRRGHAIARAHALCDELVRQLVGVGVQLGVAQAVPIVHHRNGVRRALRPLFKQDMGAALRRINFRGSVPTVQQQFALGSRQQIEMRRRLRSICRHRPQHLHR